MKCKLCKQEIMWGTLPNGRAVTLNFEPMPNGKWIVDPTSGRVMPTPRPEAFPLETRHQVHICQ